MPNARSLHRLRKRPLGRYRYVRLRWRVLFAAVDLVGAAVFRIAQRIRAAIRFSPLPQAGEGEGDPRVILLVQLDHMGDAVITSVMLPALRRRYPRASIEVLAGIWNRELFEAMPEVDRVHVSRVNRFSRTGRFGWVPATLWWGLKLRRRGIDLAVDVRGEFPLALLAWLSGARRRLGWASGGGGFLLTHSPRYVPDRPEVASRLALLAELGIRPGPGETWRPSFRPTERARALVAGRLDAPDAACEAGGPLAVLHVGAGTEAKQWPAEHWLELAARLLAEHGGQVVLVGGPGDRRTARQIARGLPCPGLVDWTGRLGLVELAALLERADVLIGADSGPAHLAAAVGTPVVVLFSGTNHPRQWMPCGRRVTVVRHPVECSPCHRARCPLAGHPCMRGLSPAGVAAAVRDRTPHAPREVLRRTEHEVRRHAERDGRGGPPAAELGLGHENQGVGR